MRLVAVCMLLLSGCASAPQCKRLTLLAVDAGTRTMLPHWHIGPSDRLTSVDGKVLIDMSGKRLAFNVSEIRLDNDRCE